MLKITTNLKSTFYLDKEIQNFMKEFYLIQRNLITSFLFLIQHNYILPQLSS